MTLSLTTSSSLNKETCRLVVADGRDIYQHQSSVEVFLSGY
ncbi:hypothetical protein BTN49_0502 [Candidatus Enterovibrio escicola]|uniref:Uncharacterized protein n=1 Tax=Candidatus Enterovibrio escicola TaxID=1927127 RepID=A0A2A5T5U7_9GAMM|nr:hypothetical protein BTN49_0502 [Candidatus Enterovibrio escacola]